MRELQETKHQAKPAVSTVGYSQGKAGGLPQ
jgi:hypothetical protein